MALPLAHRVPNPPPTFVGREAEAKRLAELLRRTPLAVVHGPRGIGKAALIAHVLHTRFKSRVPRAIRINALGEPVVVAVTRVLAAATGVGDRAASIELALDLAEACGAWLAIEARELDEELAAAAARYARTARWVFATETPPADRLIEHALALEPLASDALFELARAWHPSGRPDEHALAVEGARGSPWRLRQRIADLRAAPSAGWDAAVDLLAVVDVAIPRAWLRELVPDCDPDELADRALLAIDHDGVVLHPAARALVTSRPPAERIEQLIDRLANADRGELVAEAARCALEHGDAARTAAILERGVVPLGTRLARALLAAPHHELARWQLVAAAELGDGAHLRALAAPQDAAEL